MILVINDNLGLCESITEMFRIYGMPCYGTTIADAMKEPANLYSHLLIPEPYTSTDIEETVKNLRSKFPDSPIFKVGIPQADESNIFDAIIFPKKGKCGIVLGIVNLVLDYLGSKKYSIGNLKVSAEQTCIFYKEKTVNITKTESLILRCLILTFPSGCQKEDILKYCFRRGSYTEVSAIRTHICSINKKFQAAIGEKLILSENKKYSINENIT